MDPEAEPDHRTVLQLGKYKYHAATHLCDVTLLYQWGPSSVCDVREAAAPRGPRQRRGRRSLLFITVLRILKTLYTQNSHEQH